MPVLVALLGGGEPLRALHPESERHDGAAIPAHQAVGGVDVAALPRLRLARLRAPVVGAVLGTVDAWHVPDATPSDSTVTSLKYAHVEQERRWLLAAVPDLPPDARRLTIVDHYVRGTRLRLREVTEADGP